MLARTLLSSKAAPGVGPLPRNILVKMTYPNNNRVDSTNGVVRRTCTLAAEHDIIHELALKRSLWKNGITVISLSGGLGRPSAEIDN